MLRSYSLVPLTHGNTFSSSEKSLSLNLPLYRNFLCEGIFFSSSINVKLHKSLPICSSFHFKAIFFFRKFSSTDIALLHHSCTWLQNRFLNLGWGKQGEGTRNPGKEEEICSDPNPFWWFNANLTT